MLTTLRLKRRTGLTLIEMSMAMLFAGIFSTTIVITVADGLEMQVEADRLSAAVAVTQMKLSQLLSNPNLETSEQKGAFDEKDGIYAGYKYEIKVREEKIDLAKVAETGELDGVNLDDQLPAGFQNGGASREDKGPATQTGGVVDIVRIVMKVNYPRGRRGGEGEYRVETFRGAAKK